MRVPGLTWRGYGTALAVFALGVAGQWSAAVSAFAWLLPGAAWLAAVAWEGCYVRRHAPGLSCIAPASLHLGRTASVGLDLQGNGRWRQPVEVIWALPEGLAGEAGVRSVVLRPGGRAGVRWRVHGVRLGRCAFSTAHLSIAGPVGLSRWRLRRPAAAELTVVPDVLDQPAARGGRGRQGERRLPRPGTGTELRGLREYRPGDPLRAVDWKATARRREPVVRLYNDQQALELLMLLDVGRSSGVQAGSLSRLHHFVNISARLAEAAALAGDRLGGICYGADVVAQAPMAPGIAGVRRWRDVVRNLQSRSEESNPLLAALRARQMLSHRGLVVFLTDLTDAEAAEQTLQAVTLLGRRHLALVGAIVDVEAQAMAVEAGGGWLAPYRNLAGQELVNAQTLLAQRLRRLGADVVLDSPERLDAALLRRFDHLRRRRAV